MIANDLMLRDISYYRTGGTCQRLYQPASYGEVSAVIQEINREKLPYFLLGGGSNSLVLDEHFDGAVINFSKLTEISAEGTTVLCQAGVSNTRLAEFCFDSELSGAGWMNKLPGQVGGTVRMNARCYGGEISQIVNEVHVVNTMDGVERTLSASGCFRGYKDTVFMTNGDLIVGVRLELERATFPTEIQDLMTHCETDRVSKGQFLYPSCGCIFKNDHKLGVPSGMLLQQAGAKGMSEGGAEVSDGHGNFVYNKRQATSADILNLTFRMRDLVWKKFGVWLEYEMEILGTLAPAIYEKFHEKRKHEIKAEVLQPLRQKFSSQ